MTTITSLFQRLARHPKTSAALVFLAFFVSTYVRTVWHFDSSADMILNNGWDDGRAFYAIMTHGYKPLPLLEYRELALYPLASRAVSYLTGGVYAQMAVSATSALLCVLVFTAMLISDFGFARGEALFCAVLFIAYRTPESFLYSHAYGQPPMELLVALEGSEPLFLLFLLLGYHAMTRRRYAASACLLALASVTRINGCFFAFGAFAYLLYRRNWKGFWYVLSPAAVGLHFLYYYAACGRLLAFFQGHTPYYSGGVLAAPYYDLVMRTFSSCKGCAYMPGTSLPFLYIAHAYFVLGFIILFRKDKRLFWFTLPQYLVSISLRGWSHHWRFYIVLWGVNVAYYLVATEWLRKRSQESGARSQEKHGACAEDSGS